MDLFKQLLSIGLDPDDCRLICQIIEAHCLRDLQDFVEIFDNCYKRFAFNSSITKSFLRTIYGLKRHTIIGIYKHFFFFYYVCVIVPFAFFKMTSMSKQYFSP